jgi:enamidase
MKTLIQNIGTIVSGDIRRPIIDGSVIVIEDGLIRSVGNSGGNNADCVIDAQQATVMPGLIDSHSHPVLGDFAPKQFALNYIDSMSHGGVTRIVSAGEVHLPGRPRDIAGLKALAIVAAKSWAAVRPNGVKVFGGAPILELGMQESDFAEMAAGGVKLIGEIGLGSVRTAEDATPMVKWAKRHGMVVTIHTGGPSPAGDHHIGASVVKEVHPHIIGHINGGTTSLSPAEIEELIDTDMAIEVVHNGNIRMARHTIALAARMGVLNRVIIGTDSPSGTGVVPLGMLRMLTLFAGICGVDPATAIACATGNSAGVFRLNAGIIEANREADLVICDAPIGSVGRDALSALAAGDIPGISMVIIDGRMVLGRSRNTVPASRQAKVVKGPQPPSFVH